MQSQKVGSSAVATAKSSKGKMGVKRGAKPDHPKYKEMVTSALKELKKHRGASRQAISKYISSKYTVGSTSNHHLSTALKSMVNDQSLVLTKGVGAAGSYKINRQASTSTAAKKPGIKKATKGKKKAASKKAVKKRKLTTTKAGTKKAGIKKITKGAARKKVKTKKVAKTNKRGGKR